MENFEILKSSPAEHMDQEFMAMANALCGLLQNEGVSCRPYTSGLVFFKALALSKKEEVNERLRFYLELCQEQVSAGYKLSDNLSFTWRAFRKLELVPKSDLFTKVTDQDIVEIYSKDSRQLFRNLRFFDHCSYTLEELYSLEWWTLFDRESAITNKLLEAAGQVLDGTGEEHVYPDVGPHVVRELGSADRLVNVYEAKLLSPLSRGKKVEGIFTVLSLLNVAS